MHRTGAGTSDKLQTICVIDRLSQKGRGQKEMEEEKKKRNVSKNVSVFCADGLQRGSTWKVLHEVIMRTKQSDAWNYKCGS
jgi:hypothetical protein